MTDMIKNMRKYESVLKQKEDINISGSIFGGWEEREWLFVSMCRTIDNKWSFVITEFDEKRIPCCGIISYAITEEELDKYFYEDRKVVIAYD
jgi:hypothetical protein